MDTLSLKKIYNMKSWELLEKHRQKIWLLLGLIVHICIYVAIISFHTLLLYFEIKEISENLVLDILKWLSFTILVLIVAIPFLYSILAFVSCRIMQRIYKPIKESIANLEDFAENMNHEFKTGISEIISSTELAHVTGLYEETNEKVLWSAKRLSDILSSLSSLIYFVDLDYKKKKINIIEFLDTSIEDFETVLREKNIKIQRDYDPNKKIYATLDTAPLLLCFQNILKNAIRYSQSWWIVEIDIAGSYFSIKDYGIGIDTENTEKIFDRHFRETYSWGGQWLGLSLVKKICSIYNWSIEVQSQKWEYSIFIIRF